MKAFDEINDLVVPAIQYKISSCNPILIKKKKKNLKKKYLITSRIGTGDKIWLLQRPRPAARQQQTNFHLSLLNYTTN
jgi:hypothetical protein